MDNGENVRCKIVIDATGFETKLIAKEDPFFARGTHKALEPGYQIAYGFIAHVDSLGPYDPTAMTLFDYRTSYIPGTTSLSLICCVSFIIYYNDSHIL